jgi:ribosomal protein S18 acetylase RimI-like enzyme
MSTDARVRPPEAGELETVVELLNEHSRRVHGTDNTTVAQLQQYWESSDVDFPDDVRVAEKDGTLVGYADIGIWGEHAWLDLRGLEPEPLHPLLAAIEARAAEKKPGVNLIGYLEENDQTARETFDRAGFRVIRHSFRMEIELDALVPEPAWAEGIAVHTLREGEAKRVYDAHMESFADVWRWTPEPFDQWSHWFVNDPAFDPTLWYLAEAGTDVAGILIGNVSQTEPGLGWVRILGVVPAHRRRGIAQALLRQAFAEFRRRGLRRCGLGVDAESQTGAVELYERAGMHVARTRLQLEKVING